MNELDAMSTALVISGVMALICVGFGGLALLSDYLERRFG